MSILEMKVPSPGESISEVEIASWLVEDGEYVHKDQTIAEVDSDKATLELPAEESGIITLKAEDGDTVAVGQVVCLIDTSAKAPEGSEKPVENSSDSTDDIQVPSAPLKEETNYATGTPSPAASKIIAENQLDSNKIEGTGKAGRITKDDAISALNSSSSKPKEKPLKPGQSKQKMSLLRRKIAERLVSVKNEMAMLTTFNEVDMKPIMDIRKQYKEEFKEKHGVGLGFMSFFTKAVTQSLELFPAVNAQIDGKSMLMHEYADIGIAVSSPKGLMVPIVRNADEMTLNQIEAEIKRLAIKARDGKITPDEMSGGTFTITNGGVFGSMLSTPIINPPQSAILGMHNIVERPVAINGELAIRPIMFVALSYDHRIIDGKESVGFLVNIKELLEDPIKMLPGEEDIRVLLGL